MQQRPLQIHCTFSEAGASLRQLVQASFSLYLRRVLAEADDAAP